MERSKAGLINIQEVVFKNQEFSKAAELKQQIIELEEQKELLDSQENSFSQTVRSEEKVIYVSMCAIPMKQGKKWKIAEMRKH